jgi:hypothetical protein
METWQPTEKDTCIYTCPVVQNRRVGDLKERTYDLVMGTHVGVPGILESRNAGVANGVAAGGQHPGHPHDGVEGTFTTRTVVDIEVHLYYNSTLCTVDMG